MKNYYYWFWTLIFTLNATLIKNTFWRRREKAQYLEEWVIFDLKWFLEKHHPEKYSEFVKDRLSMILVPWKGLPEKKESELEPVQGVGDV